MTTGGILVRFPGFVREYATNHSAQESRHGDRLIGNEEPEECHLFWRELGTCVPCARESFIASLVSRREQTWTTLIWCDRVRRRHYE